MQFKSNSEIELRWCTPNADLEVVNAARVSFGKQTTELKEVDIKLINYLAEHKHMAPFRHPQFSFRIKAPEIVCRQFYKHVIGCNYTSGESTSKDHAWNEISGRYVILEDIFYIPELMRRQSKSNKQASDGIFDEVENEMLLEHYKHSIEESYKTYEYLIGHGVAKELARSVLPVSFYSEFIWTASLEAIINFIKLRTHEGAQKEIADLANDMHIIISSEAPYSSQALLNVK